jgi:hypothetical protein
MSGSSSRYVLSREEEDPNGSHELRKSLAKLQIGKPETSGGHFRDPSNKKITYKRFNTHTPPDVTHKTRIIAILGIDPAKAAPNKDGWLVSDFLAFWHLLHGMTEKQSWFHALDLEALVKAHTEYLHGNPYKSRKVVLNDKILERVQSGPHVPEKIKFGQNNMKRTFLKQLKDDCQAAEKAGENVLLLMFGHGDRDANGIVLGEGYAKELKLKEFRSALSKSTAKVTLLTTHCYAGGWTCDPDLNISAMTAAGPKRPSHSWRFSGSCGRACESMFATTVIEKLMRDSSAKNQKLDDPETDEQEESIAELSRVVYEILLSDVDRRGFLHDMTFRAEDDAWSMCWRERTGIPLGNFEERWNQLPDHVPDETLPKLHLGDPFNRDPHVTAEQRADYIKADELDLKENPPKDTRPIFGRYEAVGSALGKRKPSTLFGGSLESMIRLASVKGTEYLNCYKGHDDTSDDGPLHNNIRLIQAGHVTAQSSIEWVLNAIEYRMNQMTTADRYLKLMDVPAPNGEQCHEYDTNKVLEQVGERKHSSIERTIFDQRILFPRPMEQQGERFYKGSDYLIAAFHHAKMPKDAVTAKLEELTAFLDGELELEAEALKGNPEVRRKRQRVYHAFGKAWESVSPTKCRSRGLSLAGAA